MNPAPSHLDQAGHGDGLADVAKGSAAIRENGVAVALLELGQIERSLFTLDWLQNVEARNHVRLQPRR